MSGLTWPVYSVARVAIASRRPGHSAAQLLAWSTWSSARVSPDTDGNIVKVATRFRGDIQYMWFSQYLEKMPSSVFPIWNWDSCNVQRTSLIDRMTGSFLLKIVPRIFVCNLYWAWFVLDVKMETDKSFLFKSFAGQTRGTEPFWVDL